MDIDKLMLGHCIKVVCPSFGSLMDIDKLMLKVSNSLSVQSFGSLMDIDKLMPRACAASCTPKFWFSDGY